MSTTTDAAEVYENGQQREEEALAVISEFSETSTQNGAEPTDGGAEDQAAKENNQNDDQEQSKSQQHDSESGAVGPGEEQLKHVDSDTGGDQDKPELTEDKQDSVVGADKAISVDASTVLVETQEVVTSSTMNSQQPQHQRKHSTGRVRSAARRASYQTSRSYAGGSFQNYGLTYLPYKSNFEPSEDARRRADEFFKTLKL